MRALGFLLTDLDLALRVDFCRFSSLLGEREDREESDDKGDSD